MGRYAEKYEETWVQDVDFTHDGIHSVKENIFDQAMKYYEKFPLSEVHPHTLTKYILGGGSYTANGCLYFNKVARPNVEEMAMCEAIYMDQDLETSDDNALYGILNTNAFGQATNFGELAEADVSYQVRGDETSFVGEEFFLKDHNGNEIHFELPGELSGINEVEEKNKGEENEPLCMEEILQLIVSFHGPKALRAIAELASEHQRAKGTPIQGPVRRGHTRPQLLVRGLEYHETRRKLLHNSLQGVLDKINDEIQDVEQQNWEAKQWLAPEKKDGQWGQDEDPMLVPTHICLFHLTDGDEEAAIKLVSRIRSTINRNLVQAFGNAPWTYTDRNCIGERDWTTHSKEEVNDQLYTKQEQYTQEDEADESGYKDFSYELELASKENLSHLLYYKGGEKIKTSEGHRIAKPGEIKGWSERGLYFSRCQHEKGERFAEKLWRVLTWPRSVVVQHFEKNNPLRDDYNHSVGLNRPGPERDRIDGRWVSLPAKGQHAYNEIKRRGVGTMAGKRPTSLKDLTFHVGPSWHKTVWNKDHMDALQQAIDWRLENVEYQGLPRVPRRFCETKCQPIEDRLGELVQFMGWKLERRKYEGAEGGRLSGEPLFALRGTWSLEEALQASKKLAGLIE